MAKVNLNNGAYEEIQANITKAKEETTYLIDEIWQTHFEQLYSDIKGVLPLMYEDAESRFGLLFGGGSIVCAGAGAMGAGASAIALAGAIADGAAISACIPYVGWIVAGILAIIAGIIGIVAVCKRAEDIKFKYTARDELLNL